MNSSRPAVVRSIVAAPLTRIVAFAMLTLLLVGGAGAVDFSVGEREVIYTKKQRSNKKLATWPDGNLGVVRNANGTYDFYGANGGKPVRTTGTLEDPGKAKKGVSISGIPKKKFDYVAGGPVYQDPASGMRLMVYHAETHGKSAKDFYSVLGLAASTDPKGLKFQNLGVILQPTLPKGKAEIGGGTFAVMNDYFHIYYRDTDHSGATSELSVARASVSELVQNALSGRGTSFSKYYNGSWSEPGLGGRSSALELGNPTNGWASMSYNNHLNQLVMVSSGWAGAAPDLFLSTSTDGINWAPRQPVVLDAGEQYYPTIIGTGTDPTHSDQSFYVYYTDSNKGAWNRWKDAQLVRRQITLDPYRPPIGPDPSDPGDTTGGDWASVAVYGADFRAGGPAPGWSYAWNPNGDRGDVANFASLQWSNVAQAYNTTGGATTAPTSSKKHNDDFLILNAHGGHPGRPEYAAIAGYTIQAEDGDGLYRLANTSIQKGDSISASHEDGLGLMVFVNDDLVGSMSTVPTSGLVTTFNRELGELSVGDTVWVVVDALNSQDFDGFTNFDFTIQKSMPAVMAMAMMQSAPPQLHTEAVPEPSAAVLALLAIGAPFILRRGRRRARMA